MIILQLFLGLMLAALAGAFLSAADRGWPRVSAHTLALLCLAWIPSSGVLWIGWGKLTGFNAHFGLGDSPSTSLGDGYELINADCAAWLLYGGPEGKQVVWGVVAIAETPTHYYGVTAPTHFHEAATDGAFAVRKETGSVRYADDLSALGDESLDPNELAPIEEFPGRPRTVVDDFVLVLLFLGPLVVARRWLRSRPGDRDAAGHPADFDPDDLYYPLKLEWSDGRVSSYRNVINFVSDVEHLDGMKDDPEHELSDANGQRLYVLMKRGVISRVSFVPDGGVRPSPGVVDTA